MSLGVNIFLLSYKNRFFVSTKSSEIESQIWILENSSHQSTAIVDVLEQEIQEEEIIEKELTEEELQRECNHEYTIKYKEALGVLENNEFLMFQSIKNGECHKLEWDLKSGCWAYVAKDMTQNPFNKDQYEYVLLQSLIEWKDACNNLEKDSGEGRLSCCIYSF